MSNYWGWLEAYEHEALADRDKDKLRLCLYHADAFQFRETDPDHALAVYQEGKRLADVMGERWWSLYYSHWCAQALMHFKRDYRHVLDLTVSNALEVRKPIYDEFPQRIAIFQDLVAAYEGIDPEGHFDKIQESLATIERFITPELETRRHSLESHKRDVAMELGDYPKALEAGMRGLELVDREGNTSTARHYSVFVYAGLSEIAFRMGDWNGLMEWASVGEEQARVVGHRMELAELLTWQALALRHRGESQDARLRTSLAVALIRRLSMPPTGSFFNALCAFHEEGDELAESLAAREWELREIAGWGRSFYECRVCLEKCRLLARLRLPVEQAALATRQAASKLIKPERHLRRLDELLASKA